MELQERLRQDLAARAAATDDAVAKSMAAVSVQEGDKSASEEDVAKVVQAHAEEAATGMVTFLKEFHGDLSPEQLSQHVRDIVHSDVLIGRKDTAFRRALRRVVPAERSDWLAKDVEKHLAAVQKRSGSVTTRALALTKAQLAKTKIMATNLMTRGGVMVKEPRLHATSVSAAAGAIALGAVGGAMGAASGAGMGMAAGVVGAPFSFGLTIPLGGAVGGGVGLCAGATVGGGAGAIAAGSTGYAVYTYRVQIKDGVVYVRAKVTDGKEKATLKLTCTMASIKDQAHQKGVATKTTVMNIVGELKTKTVEGAQIVKARSLSVQDATQIRVREAIGYTKTKASEFGAKVRENKVTTGSTVVCGVAGGAAGTVTGGVAGAAVGVPAAIFTFGLSIPICSAVGSGVGLCTGAVMGSGAGAAAGTAFTRRAEIKDRACGVWSKVQSGVMDAKGKAQGHALAVKERLVGGTGGTEA
jgi:hypothetical protein